MVAGIITAVLGALEMLLLNAVLKYVLAGNIKKTVLLIIIKLALYGAAITLIMLTMKDSLIAAAIGFSVGLPGAAIVTTIISLCRNKKAATKGDERLGHSENN